jgi:hypothetical protein
MTKNSSERKIYIGGAGAFLNDSMTAVPQLLRSPKLDYLIADYLAEVTMPILARKRARHPEEGYSREFTDWTWNENLRELMRRGIKLVTNAGGHNPRACRERMLEIAKKQGLEPKIAVVDGDDVVGLMPELQNQAPREMINAGMRFPKPEAVLCANAYLGATAIAEALRQGADFVITGRVVDSALVLGPLLKEFNWALDDYDRLAAGTLAGHVIECGCQTTGGTFTDWEIVPDWAHIGYPLIECSEDGSFIVTKPEGSGGLVSRATVSEQVLYEVGNPQAYMVPDVVCDFSNVSVEEIGPNRVRVRNALGYPPTDSYKVSIGFTDGYRFIGLTPVLGMQAARKGERQAAALIERVGEILRKRDFAPFRAVRIEALGTETSYGANARNRDTREAIMRVGVEHEQREALKFYVQEFHSPAVSMSVGTTSMLGTRHEIEPVIRIFSCLVPREKITPVLSFEGRDQPIPTESPAQRYRPQVAKSPAILAASTQATTDTVRLVDLAWARSGDKGNSFNIAVIARKPEYLPYIREALDEGKLMEFFKHEFEGEREPKVVRFEAPGLDGLNLLFTGALGGGQLSSLRIDALAKAKAQQLLDFPVPVPADIKRAVA